MKTYKNPHTQVHQNIEIELVGIREIVKENRHDEELKYEVLYDQIAKLNEIVGEVVLIARNFTATSKCGNRQKKRGK